MYGVSDTPVDEAQRPQSRLLVEPAISCSVLSGQSVHNCFLVSAPLLLDRTSLLLVLL